MSEKPNPPKWVYFVGALAAVFTTITVINAFSSARNDGVSPIEQAQERAAELETQNPELAEEMRQDAEDAAARVNASRGASSDLTREDFNSGFAAWVGLKPGMDSDDAMAIIEERFGETIEGEGGLTVDIQTLYRPKGLTVILATQEGALDDSIYAQQLYAEFEPVSPVANKLVFYGLRQKCQRGENTTEWTTQRCP